MNATPATTQTPTAIPLNPRTELFIISIHAASAISRPIDNADRARALADLAYETCQAARFGAGYCTYNLNTPTTLTLTEEYRNTAAALGLPDTREATAGFLRATAVLALRLYNRHATAPSKTAVTLTAHFDAREGTFNPATIRYADGHTRNDFACPGNLTAVLRALATIEPLTEGDTLTLHLDPLTTDPIPADTSVYNGMPGTPITGEQLRYLSATLTADRYAVQMRSGGAWHLPNHDDPAILSRGEAARALRRLRDYRTSRIARFSHTDDGTVYASDGTTAARLIPTELLPNHRDGHCPGCGTDYATNGDGPCRN